MPPKKSRDKWKFGDPFTADGIEFEFEEMPDELQRKLLETIRYTLPDDPTPRTLAQAPEVLHRLTNTTSIYTIFMSAFFANTRGLAGAAFQRVLKEAKDA